LKEAGLHPFQGVFLNHSHGSVAAAGSNTNVMANGIYDFVLAYYNPKADGTFDGSDLSARLPSWSASGLTFDGLALPDGVSARNIGGIASANMVRKGTNTASVPTSGAGEPNDNFVGNITVPMANYMTGRMGISSFANTNIIGDAEKWSNYDSTIRELILIPSTNIGLIGNYNIANMHNNTIDSYGVLDMVGQVPEYLDTAHGYVNLWDDVSRETLIAYITNVVHLRGQGGEFIGSGDTSYPDRTPVVISKKYNGALVGNAAILKPYHRAFVDAGGQVRLTGSDLGIDAKYLGSNSNQPVPSLNEEDWIRFGNGATSGFSSGVSIVGGTLQLASNYVSLGSTYKWNDADDFNSNAAASAAPQSLGVRGR
jgi:hypothetical protein